MTRAYRAAMRAPFRGLLLLTFLLATLIGITPSSASETDSWAVLGEGMNGSVSAVVTAPDGSVYAGGWFTEAGGASANYVAKWDGTAWSPLGSGVNSNVYDLALDSQGNLYACGMFSQAGGSPASGVAKWNGTEWSALGSGVGWLAAALAVDSHDNLYVGGSFTTAGGNPVNHVAKWDGTEWSALGNGLPDTNDTVMSLAIDASDHLYVGGWFNTERGSPGNNIVKWDGSVWSPLGAGTNGSVRAIAIDASGAVYAAGGFTTAGGQPANYIARWDGGSWSPLGDGLGGVTDPKDPDALAFDGAGTLYVGGYFTTAGGEPASKVARWDGSTWSALGSGMETSSWIAVNAFAIDAAGNVYAGGNFTSAGGVPANRIARWVGSGGAGGGTGSSGSARTPASAQFRFLLPDGRECTAISPVTVTIGTRYTLPGVDALCRERSDSLVAGWTIPVPAGFTGAGSSSLPFYPGQVVTVADSQRFTVVPFESTLALQMDANVATLDTCTSANLDHTTDDGRTHQVWIPRADIDRARFPTVAACAPPGRSLVGWSTSGDGSGTSYLPGAAVPRGWADTVPNSRRLYAVWG